MTTTALERKLTQREVSRITGWSMTLLTRLVNRNEIPHLRIGKTVWFELSKLKAWEDARQHGPVVRGEEEAVGIPTHSRYRK